jgi:hypothetical protein
VAAANSRIVRPLLCAWAAALAASLQGCEVRFVDPDPPQLAQRSLSLAPEIAREPVVYGVVLDLFLPDAASCAQARSFFLQALADAMAPLGEVHALPPHDVSPGCAPDPGRRLDVTALEAQVRAVESSLPGRAVRPVLVYASNLDLAMPYGLLADFASLGDRATARGALPPLLWAATALDADPIFSRRVDWGHALDDGLRGRLASLSAAELPLRSQAAIASAPLLLPGDADRPLLYKVCSKDAGIGVVDAPDDGTPFAPDAQHAPYAVGHVQPLVALPASQFAPAQLHLLLESCAAHCDRYSGLVPGEDAVPWTSTRRCLFDAPAGGAQ